MHIIVLPGMERKKVDSSNDSQSLLIENHEQVTREMFDLWPDAIVNCAAVSSPDQVNQNPAAAHLVNVEGPRHLAEVASHWEPAFYIYQPIWFLTAHLHPIVRPISRTL